MTSANGNAVVKSLHAFVKYEVTSIPKPWLMESHNQCVHLLAYLALLSLTLHWCSWYFDSISSPLNDSNPQAETGCFWALHWWCCPQTTNSHDVMSFCTHLHKKIKPRTVISTSLKKSSQTIHFRTDKAQAYWLPNATVPCDKTLIVSSTVNFHQICGMSCWYLVEIGDYLEIRKPECLNRWEGGWHWEPALMHLIVATLLICRWIKGQSFRIAATNHEGYQPR
jgi:hypothetical protein